MLFRSGPFQVPLPAWSSSISLKAVAISTSGSMVSGPILSLTLTPLQTQLAAPSFNPVSGSTISQSTPVQVIPANSTTDSPRTALGGAAPTNTSSLSLSFTFPSP